MRYINFNQLRSFHAVAKTGNVTAAAKLLNISQPTVTTQLKQMEERYGVELAYRIHRGVRLSPLGEQLYKLTMRIFALEDEALDLVDAINSLQQGTLSVGAVGPFFVMKLLAEFNSNYPGIKITLNSGNSEEIIQQLLNFQIDIGIVGNIKVDPAFKIQPLVKKDVVLAIGQSHPWYKKDKIDIDELAGADLVLRESGSETRRVLEDALQENDIQPNIIMEVDRDALREASIEGLGAGVISEAEYRPGMDFKIVRIEGADIFTEAFIVCLKERAENRLVNSFMTIPDAIREKGNDLV
ncbi:MAG: LysR family transcriptional regulator [bacterium]|nr:LysR family transcriptional regulator [bacterium]